jgi:hypothetical protein
LGTGLVFKIKEFGMENQHRKIAGYRELNQNEINLMNEIKTLGSQLLTVQKELMFNLQAELTKLAVDARDSVSEESAHKLAYFKDADPLRWASIGKTDIETGVMALVRAVARPASLPTVDLTSFNGVSKTAIPENPTQDDLNAWSAANRS